MTIEYLRDYGINPSKGTLYLTGEIDDDMEVRAAQGVEILSSTRLREIKVYLNTPLGGDLQSSLTIMDILRSSRKSVRVIGFGRIYSAGMVILQAPPDPKKRELYETTSLMFHPISYHGLEGNKKTVKADMAEFNRLSLQAKRILSAACGLNLSHFEKEFSTEVYMTAEQAVERGFAHRLISKT